VVVVVVVVEEEEEEAFELSALSAAIVICGHA
jgi:hypothetical protein